MSPLIHVAGWTLVHFVWQGALIALAAAAALRLLRSASAHARYATACAALATMLASPVITARLLFDASPEGPSSQIAQAVPSHHETAVALHLSMVAGPHPRDLPPLGFFQCSWGPTPRELPLRAFALAAAQGCRLAALIRSNDPLRVAISLFTQARRATIETARSVDAVLPLLVTLWLVGVGVFLIRLAGGGWHVRRLHRAALRSAPSCWQAAAARIALRLGLSRTVYVVDSTLVDTPTVLGWLRPVVLLPVAALANLTPAQVDAILAHELAHVRRHDFVVNLLQTLAETFLFYHPGMWWLSSRVRAEREHCCDDVAVDVCGDPVAYATALTELAAWSLARAPLALAATNGPLFNRVRRVLLGRGANTHASSARTSVALVLLLVIALGGGRFLMAMQEGDARTRMDHSREHGPRRVNELLGFELFPGPRHPHGDPHRAVAWTMDLNGASGGMSFKGFTGRELIRFAYQLPKVRVLGGPNWLDTESIDLSAPLQTSPTAEDWPIVIRQHLEERLKLTVHQETREFPAYALVMANVDGRFGPNLRLATGDCFDMEAWWEAWRAAGFPPNAFRGQRQRDCGPDQRMTGITFTNVTMAELAQFLSQRGPMLDRAVVDRTGLPGRFDMDVELGLMPVAAVMNHHGAVTSLLEPLGYRSVFTALQEQLGLRLEEATAPEDVLVIDHADRPTKD